MKARAALPDTDHLCSKTDKKNQKEADFKGLCSSPLVSAIIECDPPNKKLYEFNGTLKMGGQVIRITPDNILLRGAKMRNTEWAIGNY